MTIGPFPNVRQPSNSHFLRELFYGFFPHSPTLLPYQYPDISDKTAVVTGISSGVGAQTAKLLVSKGCTVIGVVKDLDEAEKTVLKLYSELEGEHGIIKLVYCDLADLTTIETTAQQIKSLTEEIHYIIHNAGVWSSDTSQKTEQGLELHFSVNNVGPQYLQSELDNLFLSTQGPKRVVWLSSIMHFWAPIEGLYWNNPSFYDIVPPHSRNLVYGQSKAIAIYQAKAYGDLHAEVISVAVYPGNLNTNLFHDQSINKWITKPFFRKAVYGAYSELFGVFSTDVKSGDYIAPFGEVRAPRIDITDGLTNGNAKRAWDLIEDLIEQFKNDPTTTALHVKATSKTSGVSV